jgi:integrase
MPDIWGSRKRNRDQDRPEAKEEAPRNESYSWSGREDPVERHEAADDPEPPGRPTWMRSGDPDDIAAGREAYEELDDPAGVPQWEQFQEHIQQTYAWRKKGRKAAATAAQKEAAEKAECRCPKRTLEQRGTCRCAALFMFIQHMREGDLSPGTQSTYLGYLNAWVKRTLDRWTDAEYMIVYKHRKQMDREYARVKREKITAAGAAIANMVLAKLVESKKFLIAMVLYLMALTGGRYSDIVQIQYRDIDVTEHVGAGGISLGWRVDYHFRVGKNRPGTKYKHYGNERTDRCLVHLPAGGDTWMRELAEKKRKDPDGYPFKDMTTSQAGAALRKIGLGLTTYSFRKHYAARIYAEMNDKKKVSERMGHANTKMAEAYYMSLEMMSVVREYRARFGWHPDEI